jgi:hypothetical protein
MSEKSSEPDIAPCRFNVAKVPLADFAVTLKRVANLDFFFLGDRASPGRLHAARRAEPVNVGVCVSRKKHIEVASLSAGKQKAQKRTR